MPMIQMTETEPETLRSTRAHRTDRAICFANFRDLIRHWRLIRISTAGWLVDQREKSKVRGGLTQDCRWLLPAVALISSGCQVRSRLLRPSRARLVWLPANIWGCFERPVCAYQRKMRNFAKSFVEACRSSKIYPQLCISAKARCHYAFHQGPQRNRNSGLSNRLIVSVWNPNYHRPATLHSRSSRADSGSFTIAATVLMRYCRWDTSCFTSCSGWQKESNLVSSAQMISSRISKFLPSASPRRRAVPCLHGILRRTIRFLISRYTALMTVKQIGRA